MAGHTHNWQPVYGEVGRYRCRCGDTGRRQIDGSIITSAIATADPDELITARPTDDATINEFGRRLAMIPDDLRGPRSVSASELF